MASLRRSHHVSCAHTPVAYNKTSLEFIETPVFTRQILQLMSDDEYAAMQQELLDDPQRGALIKAGGGIRKMRFGLEGQGKSGGVRVIYYWLKDDGQIYMLLVYPKSEKDNLTDRETAILRELVKELCHG